MKLLITGGAGFIGHHVIEHFLRNTNFEIISLDRLSVSGNYNRVADIDCFEELKNRLKFVWHDLKSEINDLVAAEIGQVDYILHLGASTHVDRSIIDPMSFVMDNVVGTTNLLQFARKMERLKAFLYFSTDEVFGPATAWVDCLNEACPDNAPFINGRPTPTSLHTHQIAFKEWDSYNSGNPYAAAKAGGEEMALAFSNTYKIPVIITHTMNVFGERQHPEKFIPLVIKKILNGEKVTIHANKDKTKAGARMWIHARNVAAAILHLLKLWEKRDPAVQCDKFNIVGEREADNLWMANFINIEVKKGMLEDQGVIIPDLPNQFEMVDFHSSRPGHDLRYALDGEKMKALGWSLPVDFEESLRRTIRWTLQNQRWLAM